MKSIGKPDAGKPHVRFDEGGIGRSVWHADIEPQWGNPETEVGRSLNAVIYSSTLLILSENNNIPPRG